MKNNIKKVCLLMLFLLLISTIVILINGRTYVVNFNVLNKKYNFNIEGKHNIVEILEKKEENGILSISLRSKNPGRIHLIVDYDEYSEQTTLYVHKSMIITDNNYFGYSNCCEIIPISISILIMYILFLLIKRYISSVKENIYQYKNVAYLGIIVFLLNFLLINVVSIFNYNGIYETINRIINSMSIISLILFPIAFITFLLVTISNIQLSRKEGKSFKNLLGVFLGIFICVLTLLPDFTYKLLLKIQIVDIYNLNSFGPYIYIFIETLVYLIISYLECILLGTIIIGIKSVKKKIDYNKDYIIILGCQIKKDGSLTPLLKGRVDKAIEFRNKQLKENNKDLIFITSGGKGNDEIISEAQAMKNYLVENGINEKNILIDDKSRNTYENIKYSYKLINNNKSNIVFCTTNYHVFRTGLIATMQNIKIEGIGSKTKTYFWINAFIREFVGTLFSERKKHFIAFILITIIIILMIIVSYFANNI